MSHAVVLCHGRHLQTEGWETFVWGTKDKIGTAPLALCIALQKNAQLMFGSGASEKEGLKECEFTQRYLKNRLAEITQFSEFSDYRSESVYERNAFFDTALRSAYLDRVSQNTDEEVIQAVLFAKSISATELIQVTSPFHAARCMNAVAKLSEDGFDFGKVLPRVVCAKSSTETCRAATTVILEHPHRGDDAMIDSLWMPHQVFPRMFGLEPGARMQFFADTSSRLEELGV